MGIKKTSQTQYDLRYHFVWVPKRRRKVLTGKIKEKTLGLIKYACQVHDLEVFELAVEENHVHLYVGAKPRYSPSKIANLVKGWGNQRKLEKCFQGWRKITGTHHSSKMAILSEQWVPLMIL